MAAAGVYAMQRREEARRLKADAVLRRSTTASPRVSDNSSFASTETADGVPMTTAGMDTRELKKMMSGRFSRSASVEWCKAEEATVSPAATPMRRTTSPASSKVQENTPPSQDGPDVWRPRSAKQTSSTSAAKSAAETGQGRRKEEARLLRGIGSRPSPVQPSTPQATPQGVQPSSSEPKQAPQAALDTQSSAGSSHDGVASRKLLRAQLRGTRLDSSPSRDHSSPSPSGGAAAAAAATPATTPEQSAASPPSFIRHTSAAPSNVPPRPTVKPPTNSSSSRPTSAQSDKTSPTSSAPKTKQPRINSPAPSRPCPSAAGRAMPAPSPFSRPKSPPMQQQQPSKGCTPWDAGDEVYALRQARKKLSKEAFMEYVYENHPPKDSSKQLNRRLPLQKQMQKALSHYHPDKQKVAAHGPNWCLICEEICKEITRMYKKRASPTAAQS